VLLLQLVQTSAHDVRLKAKKIEKNRQNQLALKRQESYSESQAQEPFLDENDHEVRYHLTNLLSGRDSQEAYFRVGNCFVQRWIGLSDQSSENYY
jgi:cohesin loading factor subunit SCC2